MKAMIFAGSGVVTMTWSFGCEFRVAVIKGARPSVRDFGSIQLARRGSGVHPAGLPEVSRADDALAGSAGFSTERGGHEGSERVRGPRADRFERRGFDAQQPAGGHPPAG